MGREIFLKTLSALTPQAWGTVFIGSVGLALKLFCKVITDWRREDTARMQMQIQQKIEAEKIEATERQQLRQCQTDILKAFIEKEQFSQAEIFLVQSQLINSSAYNESAEMLRLSPTVQTISTTTESGKNHTATNPLH